MVSESNNRCTGMYSRGGRWYWDHRWVTCTYVSNWSVRILQVCPYVKGLLAYKSVYWGENNIIQVICFWTHAWGVSTSKFYDVSRFKLTQAELNEWFPVDMTERARAIILNGWTTLDLLSIVSLQHSHLKAMNISIRTTLSQVAPNVGLLLTVWQFLEKLCAISLEAKYRSLWKVDKWTH